MFHLPKLRLNHITVALCAALAISGSAVASPEADDIDHKKAKAKEQSTKSEDLATTTIGGLKMTIRQHGELKSGNVQFEFAPAEGQKNPKGLRAWVGDASGEGTAKKHAEAIDLGYFVDIQVPAGGAGDQYLWFEFTPASGKKSKSSIKLKP